MRPGVRFPSAPPDARGSTSACARAWRRLGRDRSWESTEIRDQDGGPLLSRTGAPADEFELADAVIAACQASLAAFKVPRAVHVVDDLPRSTLNKIAKNELRARLAG